METLRSLSRRALELAQEIGEPKLIQALEQLLYVVSDPARPDMLEEHAQCFIGFGLPLSYTWDARSLELKTLLTRMLNVGHQCHDKSILDAMSAVEDRFLLVSERIKCVEVVCRRKLHWA